MIACHSIHLQPVQLLFDITLYFFMLTIDMCELFSDLDACGLGILRLST